MKDESAQLRDELVLANERTHNLEKQLHEKEREVECNFVKMGNLVV